MKKKTSEAKVKLTSNKTIKEKIAERIRNLDAREPVKSIGPEV